MDIKRHAAFILWLRKISPDAGHVDFKEALKSEIPDCITYHLTCLEAQRIIPLRCSQNNAGAVMK